MYTKMFKTKRLIEQTISVYSSSVCLYKKHFERQVLQNGLKKMFIKKEGKSVPNESKNFMWFKNMKLKILTTPAFNERAFP